MKDFDEKRLEVEYNKKYLEYDLLGNVLRERLDECLTEKKINYDFIQMRVKKFASFFEKIFRNNINDPFNEIQDFCGLRIIHLFENDLKKIKAIVNRNFKKIEEVDKTLQSKDPRKNKEKEFSYRSYHIIVTPKDDLLNEYPQLKGLVAEIQIRTICMHAWASIEHKLNYKKQNDIPKSFRPIITRKFSQMSALLEVADEFFVSLQNDKNEIRQKIKGDFLKPNKKEKILKEELNIDILQIYLEKTFSEYKQESGRLKYLLEEMRKSRVNLRDIEIGEKALKDKRLFSYVKKNYPTDSGNPTQTGIVRLILDITNDRFYNLRKDKLRIQKWIKFVNSVKAELQK